ncbi:MAG: hypothetical protein SAL07_23425 [Oscillatoria sp. PMC 1051.18]|nr:hypothetical protein [Oscillatoria sp. PMC 1050.18]MEC5032864.1 hypothetical protein [Oscillatoria sp. PMC 1051.18]
MIEIQGTLRKNGHFSDRQTATSEEKKQTAIATGKVSPQTLKLEKELIDNTNESNN